MDDFEPKSRRRADRRKHKMSKRRSKEARELSSPKYRQRIKPCSGGHEQDSIRFSQADLNTLLEVVKEDESWSETVMPSNQTPTADQESPSNLLDTSKTLKND